MTALPFVLPEETLPGRPGYVVLEPDLDERLRAAEARAVAEPSEAAEAELAAVWAAIDAHEADERDAAAEAEWEREHE
jgi:hypothetical protein